MLTIIFASILYLITGLWICYKREWYYTYDNPSLVCWIATILMPINLIFVFVAVFLIDEWDNN